MTDSIPGTSREDCDTLDLVESCDASSVTKKDKSFSPWPDMEFVQKFTPPDFKVKNFTPSISPYFNSFSGKKHKKLVKMEKFTPLAKILHCRRHWRHWQIPPLIYQSKSCGHALIHISSCLTKWLNSVISQSKAREWSDSGLTKIWFVYFKFEIGISSCSATSLLKQIEALNIRVISNWAEEGSYRHTWYL